MFPLQELPGLDKLSPACSGTSTPRSNVLVSHGPMSPESIKLVHRHRYPGFFSPEISRISAHRCITIQGTKKQLTVLQEEQDDFWQKCLLSSFGANY